MNIALEHMTGTFLSMKIFITTLKKNTKKCILIIRSILAYLISKNKMIKRKDIFSSPKGLKIYLPQI